MKLSGTLLLITAACAFIPNAWADKKATSNSGADVTITVMKNGETPHEFLNNIQPPRVQNVIEAWFDSRAGSDLQGVTDEIHDAGEAASENASQSIMDSLSVNGKQSTPEDILHHLQPDQPLLNQVPIYAPGKAGVR